MKKIGCLLVLVVLLIGVGVFSFKYYYVFGDGVKAGELNYIVHKGYVFKTYEGRLIQAGIKTQSGTTGIQSNEFIFSVEDKSVAERLMRSSGRVVELHYKEYLGALPWRGVSEYVVDSIITIAPVTSDVNSISTIEQ